MTRRNFWAYVRRSDDPNACWEWTRKRLKKNGVRTYGVTYQGRRPNGKQIAVLAHRVAYQLTHGVVLVGGVVRHSCDNPPCCNPNHLAFGTQKDNMQDAKQKGRLSIPRGSKLRAGLTRPGLTRPGRWRLPVSIRQSVLDECLNGPRGTTARLAREHGVTPHSLGTMVFRARKQKHREQLAAA